MIGDGNPSGQFEILDLEVTIDEPDRIGVVICGLDGTSSVDDRGVEVASARTSGVLWGIILVPEGGEWKASAMDFVSGEALECVDASLP